MVPVGFNTTLVRVSWIIESELRLYGGLYPAARVRGEGKREGRSIKVVYCLAAIASQENQLVAQSHRKLLAWLCGTHVLSAVRQGG